VTAYMQDDFADRPVDKNDFAKSFYTAHRHNLHFCKTVLQTVLSAKRFAKSFYKSAIYAGGQYKQRACRRHAPTK